MYSHPYPFHACVDTKAGLRRILIAPPHRRVVLMIPRSEGSDDTNKAGQGNSHGNDAGGAGGGAVVILGVVISLAVAVAAVAVVAAAGAVAVVGTAADRQGGDGHGGVRTGALVDGGAVRVAVLVEPRRGRGLVALHLGLDGGRRGDLARVGLGLGHVEGHELRGESGHAGGHLGEGLCARLEVVERVTGLGLAGQSRRDTDEGEDESLGDHVGGCKLGESVVFWRCKVE